MIDRFTVCTIAKRFCGHKNVRFCWYVLNRKTPLGPYAERYPGFEQLDADARLLVEAYVDELFSESEARALVDFLNQHYKDATSTKIMRHSWEEVRSIIGERGLMTPFAAIPIDGIGGPVGGFSLWRNPNYTLPFKVEGFYDLRGAEGPWSFDEAAECPAFRPRP